MEWKHESQNIWEGLGFESEDEVKETLNELLQCLDPNKRASEVVENIRNKALHSEKCLRMICFGALEFHAQQAYLQEILSQL